MADDAKEMQSVFYSMLKTINMDSAEKLELERAKDSVAAAYDEIAASMEGSLWNLGLHDDEVARAIETYIPGLANLHTDGLCEQLYFFTLQQIPIKLDDYGTKSVLEVGSGSGGGLNFLSRVVDAESMIGLDISPDAVRRANSVFSRDQYLRFVQGDAEQLPFDDNRFDAVINIESAHNYPDVGAFLAEVARVLKPGGYVSHVDLYTTHRFQEVQQAKKQVPALEWISDRDVTAEVKAAVRQRMAPGSFLRTRIDEKLKTLPFFVRPLMREVIMGGFGAKFIGHKESGLVRLMGKLGANLPPDLPFETYHLSVARKR